MTANLEPVSQSGNRPSFVTERFQLDLETAEGLYHRPIPWGFGLLSEVTYYRTYSRMKDDGTQECWADTVIRVVNGVFSIRKDWYKKMGLPWDEARWQNLAGRLAEAIFTMKMLPPGRGLWAMGTDYIFERGSMALNNCGYVNVEHDLSDPACWAMDALMCGVGIGFSTENAMLGPAFKPMGSKDTYYIPDSREGWVDSVKLLIDSYFRRDVRAYEANSWQFDYSRIRPEGTPLKGFGGLTSGPKPLIDLHERVRGFLNDYADGKTDQTRLIVDVFNAIGACVVAGNIRRSAQISMGSVGDKTFLNLKNYEMYPERADIGWMSNNSVILRESDEFEELPRIAERVRDNGEPGIINLINIQKYARIGKKKPDKAIGMNPCAEIALESYELCNLVECFPTRCESIEELWQTMELATFYASTVSLLPTHDPRSNAVITRNRRIGVSVSGISDWIDSTNLSRVTMALREGYEQHVEPINTFLASEAGVPASVRLTTVKPSGTISLLAGVSPGMHWPVSRYTIRRMRISEFSPMVPLLQEAGVPCEKDFYSDMTLVFSFPQMAGEGKTRSVSEVSIWEQASLVTMLNREWADNSVSNTLTFRQAEANQIERVLAAFAPVIKSISMLPDQSESAKPYPQLPYEPINEDEYYAMAAKMGTIDWSRLNGVDGEDPQFCNNESCLLELPEQETASNTSP